MKEKDTIKGEELERVDEEIFGTFDPGDASIGGDGYSHTSTSRYTFTENSADYQGDSDFDFTELLP